MELLEPLKEKVLSNLTLLLILQLLGLRRNLLLDPRLLILWMLSVASSATQLHLLVIIFILVFVLLERSIVLLKFVGVAIQYLGIGAWFKPYAHLYRL